MIFCTYSISITLRNLFIGKCLNEIVIGITLSLEPRIVLFNYYVTILRINYNKDTYCLILDMVNCYILH